MAKPTLPRSERFNPIREQAERAWYALRSAGYFAKLQLEGGRRRRPVAGVVVGRNDDYMPDFKQRLYTTIEWNSRHLLDEVIFIEWNPPRDRELLSPGLARRFERLRAYVIPPEVHRDICKNSHLQLMEYHAKNVGVRRARADWIVSTNADAVFGLDTIDTILHAPLAEDIVWTAQRVEIDWPRSKQASIGLSTFLSYQGVLPHLPFGTGEFLLASKRLWETTRGYDESLVRHRVGCDPRGVAQMAAHGARVKRAGLVLHLAHPTSVIAVDPARPSALSWKFQPHHGEGASWTEGLPYHNSDDWGLGRLREVPLAERVWRLEP